jgi:hypothetical protein
MSNYIVKKEQKYSGEPKSGFTDTISIRKPLGFWTELITAEKKDLINGMLSIFNTRPSNSLTQEYWRTLVRASSKEQKDRELEIF